MEPNLADLLQQQKATGFSGDQMLPAAGGNPMLNPAQAMMGAQAMKNITGMAGAAPQVPQAGGAGVAPRGQQIQLKEAAPVAHTVDPRLQMGLAQLLFGGK